MFKNIWNALFSRTTPEQTIPLKQDTAEEKITTVENSLLNDENPAKDDQPANDEQPIKDESIQDEPIKDQPDDYVEVEETKHAEKVLEPIKEAERETSTDTDRTRSTSKQNVFWP